MATATSFRRLARGIIPLVSTGPLALVGLPPDVSALQVQVQVQVRAADSAAPSVRSPGRPPLDLRVVHEGVLHRITLEDGSVHFARIVTDGDPVRLGLVEGGVLEISRNRIREVRRVRGTVVDGEYWPDDPNHTRLFFGPTGRNLPRGSGSATAYYGVVPFVAYGVSDRLTLAGGVTMTRRRGPGHFPSTTPLVPDQDSSSTRGRTVHLAPKLQLYRGDRLSAAMGVLAFLEGGAGACPSGIAYGVGTWNATSRTSVTVGSGLGMVQGEWSPGPTWMVGADRRVTRRLKIVTENYRFSSGAVVGSGGFRILGRQVSVDVAGVVHSGDDGVGVSPFFNLSLGW